MQRQTAISLYFKFLSIATLIENCAGHGICHAPLFKCVVFEYYLSVTTDQGSKINRHKGKKYIRKFITTKWSVHSSRAQASGEVHKHYT